MRWIEVMDIEAPTPEGNVRMTVAATGKPLILSLAQIKARRGHIIFVDNWLYKKLAPYVVPGGGNRENNPGYRQHQSGIHDREWCHRAGH